MPIPPGPGRYSGHLIGFDPVSQDVSLGNLVSVDLVISGLGNGPDNLALGAYDLDISFDSTILKFVSADFGTGLGGPNSSVTYADSPTLGLIDICEISGLPSPTLNSSQLDIFTLVTLNFDTIFAGKSYLKVLDASIDPNFYLGDADAAVLSAELQGGEINVNGTAPVPEPATILLLASGLGGAWIFGKKKNTIG